MAAAVSVIVHGKAAAGATVTFFPPEIGCCARAEMVVMVVGWIRTVAYRNVNNINFFSDLHALSPAQ